MIDSVAQADRVHDLVHKAHDSGIYEDKRKAFIECDFLYTLLTKELLAHTEAKKCQPSHSS